MDDRRRFAPATERNREPLLQVLKRWLPRRGTILEIASGTGEHAIFFARHLPDLMFQPSDCSAEALESIEAWRQWTSVPNVLPPCPLDVEQTDTRGAAFDGLLCINMLHIAPWSCTAALFQGAARHLKRGGALVTYGPYRQGGQHSAASNAEFDAALQAQSPSWGVRNLEDVHEVAAAAGFVLAEVVRMPANNLALCFVLPDENADSAKI